MALKLAFIASGLVCASATAFAQSAQPYAEFEQREIKTYSAEQLADLRAGRGMGLALPAEMNGYPGPSHTLEIAEKLDLSPDQSISVRALFNAMRADAVPLGERLIRQEAELERLFASKSVTAEALADTTKAIGATQAELRNAHLKYHLATVAILTPEQVRRYGELRGYSGSLPKHQHRHN